MYCNWDKIVDDGFEFRRFPWCETHTHSPFHNNYWFYEIKFVHRQKREASVVLIGEQIYGQSVSLIWALFNKKPMDMPGG